MKIKISIFRFQTGLAKISNHSNRIKYQYAPMCRNFSHLYISTNHLLFECLVPTDTREKLLNLSPTVVNFVIWHLAAKRRQLSSFGVNNNININNLIPLTHRLTVRIWTKKKHSAAFVKRTKAARVIKK